MVLKIVYEVYRNVIAEWAVLKMKKKRGLPMHMIRLIEAERNLLKKRVSAATLNAQSTATHGGRPGSRQASLCTHRPLACPQSKNREKKLGRQRTAYPQTRCIFYIDMRSINTDAVLLIAEKLNTLHTTRGLRGIFIERNARWVP